MNEKNDGVSCYHTTRECHIVVKDSDRLVTILFIGKTKGQY